jgi:rhodanese-related sulfurtransferase
MPHVPILTTEELKARLDTGEETILIYVHNKADFDAGHIPGSIWVPMEELRTRASEVIPHMDSYVVVYCENDRCDEPIISAQILTQMGYENVHHYSGGMEDWIAAGLPAENDK